MADLGDCGGSTESLTRFAAAAQVGDRAGPPPCDPAVHCGPKRQAREGEGQEPEPLVLRQSDLEDLVGDDHPVRAVWSFVEGLDLRALYAEVRAVADNERGEPAERGFGDDASGRAGREADAGERRSARA